MVVIGAPELSLATGKSAYRKLLTKVKHGFRMCASETIMLGTVCRYRVSENVQLAILVRRFPRRGFAH